MTGDSDTRRALIEKLKKQIDVVFHAVQKANKHFWPGLIDPDDYLKGLPAAYSRGSVEEVKLVLRWNYEAWEETPGAIGWIESQLEDDL
jgi:hypothetical protein